MTYKEKLKDPRWINLRNKVIDVFQRCSGCGNPDALQVHHKFYIPGRQPWEYDVHDLIPLCSGCHNIFHENKSKIESVLTNPRLFFGYEFETVIKIIELLCDIETNNISKVLNYVNDLHSNEIKF